MAEGFKRLQFIADLAGLRGVGYDELAAKLGVSRPVIYSAIKEDDMNLSRAEAICQILDSNLSFKLFAPGEDVDVTVGGKDIRHNGDGSFKVKRLAFLSAYLDAKGISRVELANRMGLGWSTVATWFRKDDIKISRLFQIADSLGFSVRVDLKVNDYPANPTNHSARTFSVNISQSRVTILGRD